MKSLLIIIDMQEGFRYRESEEIVPAILKIANNFQGDIVFSCFYNKKHSNFERKLGWKKFQSKWQQKIFPELRKVSSKDFKHSGYTVLNKPLLKFISRKHVTTIFLSGIYTDICISKAAMDAFDMGLSVKVVSNACASLHGKRHHKYALESMKHAIGSKNVIKL